MSTKEKLIKMIKKMPSSAVMVFSAKQLGYDNWASMLLKNAHKLAVMAVKFGWVKGEQIKDAAKNLSDKTHDDDTGIDWNNLDIDESTLRMTCLFDKQQVEKLVDFAKQLGDKISAFASKKSIDEVDKVKNVTNVATGIFDLVGQPEVMDKATKKAKEAAATTIQKIAGDNPIAQKLIKKIADDNDAKKKAAQLAGISKFTPFGWARIAAKTTGYILNHGKDVIDAIGAKKIALYEDKSVIAEIRVLISNDEEQEKKYSDTEFSIRFTIGDFKWHATCIDDRKMKFPDDKLIKAVFKTDSGNKFKEQCLKLWKSVFKADPDGDYAMLPIVIHNISNLDLDGVDKRFVKTVIEMRDNFDKIQNQFETDDDNINESDDKIPEDIPEEKHGLFKKLYDILKKEFKEGGAPEAAAPWLDELFMGNFKDAVLQLWQNKDSDAFSDDSKINDVIEQLKLFDGYKKAVKDAEENIQSRKDSETSIDIDQNSAKFMAMWYSAKPEENLGKILSDLVKNVQQNAKKLEDDMKQLKEQLKKMKIDLTDKQLSTCAPVLFKMLNDKASEKEIRKTIEQLTKQVNESVRRALIGKYGMKALNESKFMITESERTQLMFESIYGNMMIMEAVTEKLLYEGWFGDKLSKLKNSKAVELIKQKSAQLSKRLIDTGSDVLQAMSKYSIGPILSLGGIAVGAITGGLYAELIIKAMDFVEKNGKVLKNTFERCATMHANTKGVITKTDYHLSGDEKKTYSLRFYEKDMVWRVLNTADQLKHPSIKYCKQIVEGDFGKKYREQLKKIWDPLFSDAKGGKIDFVKLLEQSKTVKISEKALQEFQQFADNYEKIVMNCIEQPKIDTRAQSLKNIIN